MAKKPTQGRLRRQSTPKLGLHPRPSKTGGFRYVISQGGRTQDIVSEKTYGTPGAALNAGVRLLRQLGTLFDKSSDVIVERYNKDGLLNSTTTLKSV